MKILQIGIIPPPVNGIAVHVRRLCLQCQSHGIGIEVFNYGSSYGSRYGSSHSAPSFNFSLKSGSKNKLLAAAQLLKTIATTKADIAHLHASRMGNFLKIAPIYLTLGKRTKHVITLHGSFNHSFERSSSKAQANMMEILKRFSYIIATNRHQQELLVGNGISKKHVSTIPAFLPLPTSELGHNPLNKKLEILLNGDRRIIVASGSLEPRLGFVPLLEAIKLMSTCPNSFFLVIATYDRCIPEYTQKVMGLAANIENVLICSDLQEAEFAKLLSRSHIFVRPTTEDGDSIALREAIFSKNQIAASDAVPRPKGALLFDMRDPSQIAKALDKTLSEPTQGICEDSSNNFEAIKSIYIALYTDR